MQAGLERQCAYTIPVDTWQFWPVKEVGAILGKLTRSRFLLFSAASLLIVDMGWHLKLCIDGYVPLELLEKSCTTGMLKAWVPTSWRHFPFRTGGCVEYSIMPFVTMAVNLASRMSNQTDLWSPTAIMWNSRALFFIRTQTPGTRKHRSNMFVAWCFPFT